jgi:hypothetical protein
MRVSERSHATARPPTAPFEAWSLRTLTIQISKGAQMDAGKVFVLIMSVLVIAILAYLDLNARRNRKTPGKE